MTEKYDLTKYLSTAIESSAEGILITDTKGHIVYFNQAFGYLFGYTLKDKDGLNVLNHIQMPNNKQTSNTIASAI